MKNKYRFDKDFEVTGFFNLAGKSVKNGITGKLIYNKDDLINDFTLEVYGDFFELTGKNSTNKDDSNKLYTIVGFSQDGYTLIMDNATFKNNIYVELGIPYIKFNIGRCLFLRINYYNNMDSTINEIAKIGIDNLKVINSEFNFTGINEWLNEGIIKRYIKDDCYSIYFNPKEISNRNHIIKDANLSLTNCAYVRTTEKNQLIENHNWRLKPINNRKFDILDAKDYIDKFKELLQFLCNTPVDFEYLKLNIFIENLYDNLINGFFIYSQYKAFNQPNKIKIDIPYNIIKDDFEVIVNNWFDKRDELSIIIENYLDAISSNYYNHIKLLNSIKNLEIFHRNFIEDKSESKNDDLEKDRDILIDFINRNISNEKNKNKFIRNINYDSEITLEQRLRDIFKNLDEDIKQKIFKVKGKSPSKNIKSKAHKLAQTRNYYTHGDISKLNNSIIQKGSDIVEYTLMLNQILKYYIYKELFSLDKDKIEFIKKGFDKIKLIKEEYEIEIKNNSLKEIKNNNKNSKLNPAERRRVIFKILVYYRNSIKVSDFSNIFTVSTSTIRRDLNKLKEDGLIRFVKKGKDTKYEIISKAINFDFEPL